MIKAEVHHFNASISGAVTATINAIRQPFNWANEAPTPRSLISEDLRQSLQRAAPDSLNVVSQAEKSTNEKTIKVSETLGALAGTGVLFEGLVVGWQSVPEFHNLPVTIWAKTIQSLFTGLVGMAFTRKLVSEASYRLIQPMASARIERDIRNWAGSERIDLTAN